MSVGDIASDLYRALAYTKAELPVKILAPSTPSDYDTWWHDATGVRICSLLEALDVKRLYGDSYGLDLDRIYDDVDEVAELVEDWLWENTDVGTKIYSPMSYDMHEWIKVYRPIARMMAEDMPWHECVVIDCY